MSRKNTNGCPKCRRDSCFANYNGKCVALEKVNFKGDCPFYKERWEKQLEDMRCEARVIAWEEKKEREGKEHRKKRESGSG